MIGRFRQEETAAVGQADAHPGLGEVLRDKRADLGKSLLDVQRELKIKATYIAAIERADTTPFETPGFVAGYVRSYARYLGLDPEWAYGAFRDESGFTGPAPKAAPAPAPAPAARRGGSQPFTGLGVPPSHHGILARIELGAIGSVAILVGLIAVLGYGGYAVLTEIQQVQLVPVEEAPEVVAEIDPLDAAEPIPDTAAGPEAAVAAAGFDRLYRPDPLDVPVIIARDGPIATLDPDQTGALAGLGADRVASSSIDLVPGIGALAGSRDRVPTATERAVLAALGQVPEGEAARAALAAGPDEEASPRPQVVADTVPEVVVFAVRPSWVRIRSAEGTTLYEAIMEEGDRFVLPATEAPATLRTGESGAIYFSVAGTPYGPAGRPGAVTGNVPLAAASLVETYEVADPASDTALSRVVVELQADPPRRPGAPAAE